MKEILMEPTFTLGVCVGFGSVLDKIDGRDSGTEGYFLCFFFGRTEGYFLTTMVERRKYNATKYKGYPIL